MTIFVDELQKWPLDFVAEGARRHGRNWCHMWTNADVEVLHEFARAIGLKRAWFQEHHILDHYDLVPNKRKLALRMGAQFMSGMDRAREQVRERMEESND